jgi:hypothetical protein
MVIGFKERFIEKINDGTKIHTIRVDKHDRWKSGMKMHMATGVRTKKYHQFDERICIGVQNISILYQKPYYKKGKCYQDVFIFIDNHFFGEANFVENAIYCYDSKIKELSINDGFYDEIEFFKWFNKDFNGKIIHWTNKRY